MLQHHPPTLCRGFPIDQQICHIVPSHTHGAYLNTTQDCDDYRRHSLAKPRASSSTTSLDGREKDVGHLTQPDIRDPGDTHAIGQQRGRRSAGWQLDDCHGHDGRQARALRKSRHPIRTRNYHERTKWARVTSLSRRRRRVVLVGQVRRARQRQPVCVQQPWQPHLSTKLRGLL